MLFDQSTGEMTPAGTDYLAKLDALTGVRKARLRDGRWVAAEGQIYEGWDPAIHLIDAFPIPASWPRYWDIDFGFVNPFVWHWWAVDPDGRLYLYREIYATQGLVTEHAALGMHLSQGEPQPREIITDHDAEDRATFERATRLKTTAADKRVSPGIQAVAERLKVQGDGKPRLFILRNALVKQDRSLRDAGKPTCTAEEWDSYVWDTRLNRRKGEEPMKEDDHGLDGTRYQVAYHDLRRKKHLRGYS